MQNQTYRNIEIIVVDDGSSDETQVFLRGFNDPRVKTLKNARPQGACHARNKGISASSGEFITFLDDDDEFLPTRLEKMLQAWDDEYAFVATGLIFQKKAGTRKLIPQKHLKLNDLLFQQMVGISVLTKKNRVLEIDGFDENLKSSQDYDFVIRLMLKRNKSVVIQEPLYIVHTEHEKERITVSKNKVNGHFSFYQKHKHLMTDEQKKAKIFELLKYKNRKIGVLKAWKLGKSKTSKEVLKYILRSRYPNLAAEVKKLF